MRLAWFCPLPPIPSGIADYSLELLPLLAKGAHVDVFSPTTWNRRPVEAPFGISVVPPDEFSSVAGAYDAVFHHLGNNPHHDFVYQAAVRHRGVVVFHDLVQHHLLAHGLVDPAKRARYREVLTREHGRAGESLLELAGRRVNTDFEKFLFPLIASLARTARAIVVHSEYARAAMGDLVPQAPIWVIPHHGGIPPVAVAGVDRAGAREALGLAPDSFLVGHFGFVTRPKQPAVVLGAIRKLIEHRPDALLLLVGENQSGAGLTTLIDRSGLGAHVRITGYVDLERLYLFLKAVDVVVNLRYPSAGESSGTVARALAEGRATIVSNVGAFAEFPDDVVLKVDVDGDQAVELAANLVHLAESPPFRNELERRARAYARTALDVRRCAELYLAVAAEASGARSAPVVAP